MASFAKLKRENILTIWNQFVDFFHELIMVGCLVTNNKIFNKS
jgi:hypothetical protein